MSEHSSSKENENLSKSKEEDTFQAIKESIEKGVDNSFKTLNNSLYTLIKSAFSTINTNYEKKLDLNQEDSKHKKSNLEEKLKNLKAEKTRLKTSKKVQQKRIIEQFRSIQDLKLKGKIFSRLYQFSFEHQARKVRDDVIINYLSNRRRFLIFNSWRNLTSSLIKGRIKLKFNDAYNKTYNQIQTEFDQEMERLNMILENLQNDIQKEMDERRNLSKLYDLSMKKGVDAFLKETNYMINFNSSVIQTPNERSFAEENRSNSSKYNS